MPAWFSHSRFDSLYAGHHGLALLLRPLFNISLQWGRLRINRLSLFRHAGAIIVPIACTIIWPATVLSSRPAAGSCALHHAGTNIGRGMSFHQIAPPWSDKTREITILARRLSANISLDGFDVNAAARHQRLFWDCGMARHRGRKEA